MICHHNSKIYVFNSYSSVIFCYSLLSEANFYFEEKGRCPVVNFANLTSLPEGLTARAASGEETVVW